MTKTFRHTYLRRALLASTVAIGVGLAAAPASAQIVFDPSNYAQNVLTAARALQQINNQITSLANQTQMLVNQARNLTNLPTSMLSQIEGNFSKMTSLMGEAERLAYNVQNIDQQFQPTYKNFAANKTSAQLVDGARQRWQEALDAYQHALKAGVAVGNIQDTQRQTGSLVSASQSAVGCFRRRKPGSGSSASGPTACRPHRDAGRAGPSRCSRKSEPRRRSRRDGSAAS